MCGSQQQYIEDNAAGPPSHKNQPSSPHSGRTSKAQTGRIQQPSHPQPPRYVPDVLWMRCCQRQRSLSSSWRYVPLGRHVVCVCVSVKWCRSIGAKRESFVGEIETAEKVKNIQIQLARITAFTNHPNSLSSAVYTAATTDERETKHYTRYMSRHIIFWSSYHLQKHLITLRRADRVRPLLPLCSPIRDNDSIL